MIFIQALQEVTSVLHESASSLGLWRGDVDVLFRAEHLATTSQPFVQLHASTLIMVYYK